MPLALILVAVERLPLEPSFGSARAASVYARRGLLDRPLSFVVVSSIPVPGRAEGFLRCALRLQAGDVGGELVDLLAQGEPTLGMRAHSAVTLQLVGEGFS